MLIHQVFLRFAPNLDALFIEQQILPKLLELKNEISEIQSASWVKNITQEPRSLGFIYQAILKFNNQNDLNIYLAHSSHIAFSKQYLLPNLANPNDDILVFDFIE